VERSLVEEGIAIKLKEMDVKEKGKLWWKV
jgi:hypothetical protein